MTKTPPLTVVAATRYYDQKDKVARMKEELFNQEYELNLRWSEWRSALIRSGALEEEGTKELEEEPSWTNGLPG